MSKFQIDDLVKTHSPGHKKDGRVGKVMYYGKALGTWGVEIDGETYGFFTSELTKYEQVS